MMPMILSVVAALIAPDLFRGDEPRPLQDTDVLLQARRTRNKSSGRNLGCAASGRHAQVKAKSRSAVRRRDLIDGSAARAGSRAGDDYSCDCGSFRRYQFRKLSTVRIGQR